MPSARSSSAFATSSPHSEPMAAAATPSSYADADRWLLGLELFGMDFGTERMERLLGEVGDPQARFRTVHVVGSNGKSSTTRLVDTILRAHGIRSGAYLSPHLRSWTERVLVAGEPVPEELFAASVAQVAAAAARVDADRQFGPVTQFEALTAAGFLALASEGVEAAVVEAGLGGRLDATNVIGAPVTICTSVGLEHTRWLGETVAEIAAEKLDVVAPGSVLVVPSDLDPDAMGVAIAVTRERGARLVVAPSSSRLAPAGTPPYLAHNLALALAASHVLLGAIDEAAVTDALGEGALQMPGRFETVAQRPLTIFDGAHNADGMAALAAALRGAGCPRPVVACVAILDDKDRESMLRAVTELADLLVVTGCSHPRAVPPGDLAGVAGGFGAQVREVAEPHAALAAARELAGEEGTVVVTGSLYLIADLGRPPGSRGGSTL
jgi:dihydrofolate synthase/folylpolyglutamate synthase